MDLTTTNISYSKLEKEEFSNMLTKLQSVTKKNKSFIAQKENLLEISSNSQNELIKAAYHLGNRHVELEICNKLILTKSDYVIEEMLNKFNVNVVKIQKKFF